MAFGYYQGWDLPILWTIQNGVKNRRLKPCLINFYQNIKELARSDLGEFRFDPSPLASGSFIDGAFFGALVIAYRNQADVDTASIAPQ